MNQGENEFYENAVESLIAELRATYHKEVFYAEGDLVDWVFRKLKSSVQDNNSEDRVFMEYPFTRTVPANSIMSLNGEYEELFKIFYKINSKGRYELIFDKVNSKTDLYNLFTAIKQIPLSSEEDKYADIAIIQGYLTKSEENGIKNDNLIAPEVLIEFKYEPSKTRVGLDFRNGYTKRNHNSSGSIWKDVFYLYCNTLEEKYKNSVGYFVFVDEDGKQKDTVAKIFTVFEQNERQDLFKKVDNNNNILVLKFKSGNCEVL